MHFTIITPSFNQLDLLKRCAASVRDQVAASFRHHDLGAKLGGILKPNTVNIKHRVEEPITVHHHIQDGGSTDGSREFLEKLCGNDRSLSLIDRGEQNLNSEHSTVYQLTFASEPDRGMYDALNRGIDFVLQNQVDKCLLLNGEEVLTGAEEKPSINDQRSIINSSNQVVAWLNCDEQYLPGTLEKVAHYFERHPAVDVVCGDVLVVDGSGMLTGFWKAMPLRPSYIRSGYLYNLSCAIFFRASVFADGLRFDTSFRAVGDQDFFIRLLSRNIRTAVIREYLSAYAFLAGNLSEQQFAKDERSLLVNRLTRTERLMKPFVCVVRRVERLLFGCKRQRFPLSYSLYIDDLKNRTDFSSGAVSGRWPGER